MAGSSNLKGIILHATDGGALNVEFERPSGHALIQDNEFGHRMFSAIERGGFQVKRKSMDKRVLFQPRFSAIRRNSTKQRRAVIRSRRYQDDIGRNAQNTGFFLCGILNGLVVQIDTMHADLGRQRGGIHGKTMVPG